MKQISLKDDKTKRIYQKYHQHQKYHQLYRCTAKDNWVEMEICRTQDRTTADGIH